MAFIYFNSFSSGGFFSLKHSWIFLFTVSLYLVIALSSYSFFMLHESFKRKNWLNVTPWNEIEFKNSTLQWKIIGMVVKKRLMDFIRSKPLWQYSEWNSLAKRQQDSLNSQVQQKKKCRKIDSIARMNSQEHHHFSQLYSFSKRRKWREMNRGTWKCTFISPLFHDKNWNSFAFQSLLTINV